MLTPEALSICIVTAAYTLMWQIACRAVKMFLEMNNLTLSVLQLFFVIADSCFLLFLISILNLQCRA